MLSAVTVLAVLFKKLVVPLNCSITATTAISNCCIWFLFYFSNQC
jgi:hypothetical protein